MISENNGSDCAPAEGARRRGAVRGVRIARAVSLVGIMAATVECGKLVLSAIPNVEVVTLLLGLYGYVFGGLGVLAAVVFVCIEPLIWGVGSWVLSYFIYWPLLAAVFWLLGRVCRSKVLVPTAVALGMTLLFGVLTSLIDVGLFSGSYDRFLYRFGIYYMRGIWFYVAQLVTNAVLFPLLFAPLSRLLRRVAIGWRKDKL